ncbi:MULTISPECIES: hypothetical protein [Streptomyces]|uniref:hypothetical protein n=1 Tax=Streptomyces TaxID=1883 RepID=UPI00163CC2EE|nr:MULTISPECIES: hypothetical protein [Streptomyces]MBC2878327.1 hypothetical protein [Streptomyces sp. TYQ1024]UBI40557.1 hypothetical protein K7I03_31590 [Streptomyces mobaraensis]UKW33138.1 hypothetical protein MCU78_31510 [Streptomyces sp. TYQ1024]
MTTPLTGPQSYPAPPPFPAFPPPLPPVPPRRRRRGLVAGGVALAVLVGGGGAGAWWLTRDGDGSPLAGRPRVADGAAGLSYAIPKGWERDSKHELIDAFTTAIGRKKQDDHHMAVVLTGRSSAIPQDRLRLWAERSARSNAEFFYPDRPVTPEESRPTSVDGHPAHTVALRVDAEEGGPARLRMTLLQVDGTRTAFLLGIDQPAGGPVEEEVDQVLESAEVTGGGKAPEGRSGGGGRPETAGWSEAGGRPETAAWSEAGERPGPAAPSEAGGRSGPAARSEAGDRSGSGTPSRALPEYGTDRRRL